MAEQPPFAVGQRVRCVASTAATLSGRELEGLAGVVVNVVAPLLPGEQWDIQVVYDDIRPRLLFHHWPADLVALDKGEA